MNIYKKATILCNFKMDQLVEHRAETRKDLMS